jgi:small subunit ribosomal protein S8
MTDPIADMLTRIRNAIASDAATVWVPASRIKLEICRILKEQGYVKEYRVNEEGKFKTIIVELARGDRGFVISELKRVSKPGRRVYVNKNEIPRVKGGLGISILSTSRGIMTGLDARKLGIGGELIATVW